MPPPPAGAAAESSFFGSSFFMSPPPVIALVAHLVNSSVTSCIFFVSSSLTLASLSALFAISWDHLVISSVTLSAQALSLHLHILSLNSPIFAIASPAPPFFLQPPKDASARAAANAIVIFFIVLSRSVEESRLVGPSDESNRAKTEVHPR